MRTIIVKKKPAEVPDEMMGNGMVRRYQGQRGKMKPKKGMMLTVIRAGLAPQGKRA